MSKIKMVRYVCNDVYESDHRLHKTVRGNRMVYVQRTGRIRLSIRGTNSVICKGCCMQVRNTQHDCYRRPTRAQILAKRVATGYKPDNFHKELIKRLLQANVRAVLEKRVEVSADGVHWSPLVGCSATCTHRCAELLDTERPDLDDYNTYMREDWKVACLEHMPRTDLDRPPRRNR